jgi:uncharacterized protein (DUF433 family)
MPIGWKNHIASDPEILRGKPRLKGTRIPVGLVLGYLAAGKTAEDIIAEFPDLTRDQIAACLDYARELAEFEAVVWWPSGSWLTTVSRTPLSKPLREANHEVLRLKDVLPVESSDTIVITKAQEIDAILLSLNGDFSHIVNSPPKSYKGIVAMQMHNHSEILPKLIARLTAYLKAHTTMYHCRGKLFVVEVDRIRIRE